MAYSTWHIQPKWFSASEVKNPKKSSATLELSGNVSNNDTVTIGTEIYEFKTSGNATTGRIKVDVSEAQTKTAAAIALADTINANSTLVDAVVDEDDNENAIVVVSYKTVDPAGNDVAVNKSGTNLSWGASVTKLSGGQYGTPCPTRNVVVFVSPYYYLCEKEGSETTVSWKRFTPASY